MRKYRFALGLLLRRTICSWRAILLSALFSLALGCSFCLMLSDGERAKRAGYALVGTLVGMCCIALIVCRK